MKAKKPYAGKIPFDLAGNLISQVCYWNEKDVAVWKDNEPFCGVLKIVDYFRGRSAAGFTLLNKDGGSLAMRMQHFTAMIVNCHCQEGTVDGTWQYAKQGSAYSLVWLGLPETEAITL